MDRSKSQLVPCAVNKPASAMGHPRQRPEVAKRVHHSYVEAVSAKSFGEYDDVEAELIYSQIWRKNIHT